MKSENYDKSLQKIIDENIKKGVRPTMLLHSCCAPCSSACIERLKEGFDLTVYYYNPNIDTDEEYELRAKEQKRLCETLGIKTVSEEHRSAEFYAAASGFENEPEGGKRCEKCFALRLKKTAEYAKEKGLDCFATTLTVSPLKNAALINAIGEKAAEEKGIKYIPSDFKKRNGYLRSIELSKVYSLYRQNYCGCVYSKNKNPV